MPSSKQSWRGLPLLRKDLIQEAARKRTCVLRVSYAVAVAGIGVLIAAFIMLVLPGLSSHCLWQLRHHADARLGRLPSRDLD